MEFPWVTISCFFVAHVCWWYPHWCSWNPMFCSWNHIKSLSELIWKQ
jgi:hypothetical protein